MTTLVGEMSSISTIRNLSLLQRSMQRTQTRPASDEEGEGQEQQTQAQPANSEQMRSQIGKLTEMLRSMESALEKNQTAAGALAGLRQQLLDMRKLSQTAAQAEAMPEEEVAGWQQQLEGAEAAYDEQKSAARWQEQRLLDGSPGSVLNLRNVDGLRIDDPSDAKQAVAKLDAAIKEVDHAQAQLTASSESVYESALRSLEVSSQNVSAAQSVAHDSESATKQAEYIKKVIGLDAGLAANAQGNLIGESVFRLMEA